MLRNIKSKFLTKHKGCEKIVYEHQQLLNILLINIQTISNNIKLIASTATRQIAIAHNKTTLSRIDVMY